MMERWDAECISWYHTHFSRYVPGTWYLVCIIRMYCSTKLINNVCGKTVWIYICLILDAGGWIQLYRYIYLLGVYLYFRCTALLLQYDLCSLPPLLAQPVVYTYICVFDTTSSHNACGKTVWVYYIVEAGAWIQRGLGIFIFSVCVHGSVSSPPSSCPASRIYIYLRF